MQHSANGQIVDQREMIEFMKPGEILTNLGPKRGAPSLFSITKKEIQNNN
jgi:hypothetical protein